MANMKEVAKYAGVSVITVSRVINNPEIVKKETREKVESVIEKLKYQGNQAARALVSNKTRVIHVFIKQEIRMVDPFGMHFVAGISDALSEKYYSFLVRRDWDFPYKCDGIIAMGISKDEEPLIKEKFSVPTVLFGHSDLDIDSVDVDNFSGAYDMTKHLIESGHKDIGIIVINDINRRYVFDRLNGYKKALTEHGIPVRSDLIKFGENNEQGGYYKAIELLGESNVSAICCTSDALALGAIRACRQFKKNVPHDVSVTGFDGLGYEMLTDPKITTVQQPVYEAGKELAELLIEKIEKPETPMIQKMIKPQILFNNSVFMKE
ncbi:LacI family DNA-binding transcriptional regulator [Evansella cellulosilytica]|uniref:Transcriptional regulator, LacI family n=1 Tax=Evansella cellulosilytica (strain ATCC 21833 / DSM 2522 / FERM P-1141 / JCM 9156 / N-4) TaxID=649639 RepID=E6TQX3_EVAC2|nr:LacI family DNA-binding transcriptional regulator [Evansella cellulosilytica]ADU31748.1 transcriptional regulator, LacI family [Evansella cellulosilytica DSM 2522]